MHRVFKFHQTAWLKSYIDMITDLRNKSNIDFEKYYFKLTNNAVFAGKLEKTYRIQTCNKRSKEELFSIRTKLPYKIYHKYQPLIFLFKNFVYHGSKRMQIFINKPHYLGLSTL